MRAGPALVAAAAAACIGACGFPDVTYRDGVGDDGGPAVEAATNDARGGSDARDDLEAWADPDGVAEAAGDVADGGAGRDGDAQGIAEGSADTGGDADAATGTEGGGTEGGVDGGLDGGAESSVESGAESGVESGTDARSDGPTDAPTDAVSDASADGSACDQDHDGFRALACGGTDCCDTDALARPNQTAYFTTADACGSFDYNCNGHDDPEFAENLACSGTVLSRQGGSGFIGTEMCGQSGPYGTCMAGGVLGCAPGGITTQTQACQ
jgi:hypothetical protein